MTEPPLTVDEVLFRYLEVRDRSEEEAELVLRQARESSADGGAALERALARLVESGLLDDGPRDEGFGPYRLERRVARGGMGEVYRAVPRGGDGEPVALKLLRPELRDHPASRERFAREAEALARIDHPSIAALVDSGEAGGVPYLAFELVQGVTLEGALRGASESGTEGRDGGDLARALDAAPPLLDGTWPEACARVLREVLMALAHAHGRGVVHRDVKPSNVMLTPGGRVVVLDFGLASVEEADRMTREGHRVGSLPYMAPELVARGGRGDARTDVYAVGVMLAEMLIGRLPFEARAPERLALEIGAGVPRVVVALTRSDAPIEAELGRVARCAMDPSRALRYPTAEAMAADLTEVLEGRRARAREPGLPTQIIRAARRRPVLSTALACMALAGLIGPVAYGVIQGGHARETARLNLELEGALQAEAAARVRATEAADRALFAIESQLRRVVSLGLENVPGARGVRESLLESAVDLLADLDAPPELEPKVRYLRAVLTRTEADLALEAGNAEEALGLYQRQLEVVRALRAERSDGMRLTFELGSNLLQQARVLRGLGRGDEARDFYEEGLPHLRAAAEAGWAEGRSVQSLAQALANRAGLARDAGEREEAAAMEAEARALLDGLPTALAAEPRAILTRAQLDELDAVEARSRGDWRAAVEHERRRAEGLARGIEAAPHHRRLRLTRATARTRLARALEMSGSAAEASAELEAAAVELDALAASYPRWADATQEAIELSGMRAQLAIRRGDADGALGHGQECVDRWRAAAHLTARDAGLATALTNLSNTIIMVGREDRASLERAVALADEAIELMENGAGAPSRGRMACTLLYNRAVPRARLGELALAARDLERAEDAVGSGGGSPMQLRLLADGWAEVRLAARERDAEMRARAEVRLLELLGEAVDGGYRDAAEIATNATLDDLRDDRRLRAIVERIAR